MQVVDVVAVCPQTPLHAALGHPVQETTRYECIVIVYAAVVVQVSRELTGSRACKRTRRRFERGGAATATAAAAASASHIGPAPRRLAFHYHCSSARARAHTHACARSDPVLGRLTGTCLTARPAPSSHGIYLYSYAPARARACVCVCVYYNVYQMQQCPLTRCPESSSSSSSSIPPTVWVKCVSPTRETDWHSNTYYTYRYTHTDKFTFLRYLSVYCIYIYIYTHSINVVYVNTYVL